MMQHDDAIFIAGHRGLVGSAIYEYLQNLGFSNLITKTKQEFDLRDQSEVNNFFACNRIEYVFLCAAVVGGIGANNQYPVKFIRDNLLIQSNVINAACESAVKKLCFLGSSCIYPRHALQPITEDQLLAGYLEHTNESYAIAKIAGIKLCQAYAREYGFNAISLMPTNLYGPHDNFDPDHGHVIPALLRKIHHAKIMNLPSVEVWGTGTPLREFLYVEDLADACYFLMQNYNDYDIINVGTGIDVSIKQLVEMICSIVDYTGEIVWNTAKPDGTPRKLLDVSKINDLGWQHHTNLSDGLAKLYKWYLKNYNL